MARHTVKQVARLSGVSVRTLHYYDEIGLLTPGDVGANGYRYYDRPELLRLQQILFYRDLGMPLADIAKTIDDPAFDKVEALQDHRRHLESELDRHHHLIRTIDETIEELRGETTMTESNPFKGFSPEKQQAYEKELVDNHGDYAKEHIAESKKRVGKMSPEQMDAIKAEGHEINKALVLRIEAGDEPVSSAVQALITRQHAWVSNFWTPNKEAYIGLGSQYTQHPDFRAFYDAYDKRLVDFLSAAMKIYAEVNLD